MTLLLSPHSLALFGVWRVVCNSVLVSSRKMSRFGNFMRREGVASWGGVLGDQAKKDRLERMIPGLQI